ncbi:receptor-like protein EIX2 [Silene latifolia]|uniref:receptor-like protein EIX2 n=1 Tax=Silene latifolia TaxID=37657 RepID=UPI003D787EF3
MLRTCLITHFLFMLLLNLSALNVHQGLVVGCHDVEREALLKFKHSLTDSSNKLSSWKGKGCCDWDGVGCDNVTAFVTHLHLPNTSCYSDYGYTDSRAVLTASKLNPSLLELSQLRYLDLSCSDFQGSPIPKFIGSFKYLRYLNLSNSNFGGVVPSQLGNLTRLQTLGLSSSFLMQHPLSTDLHWASKLVSLQYLNMGHTVISHNSVLNTPSLLGLYLTASHLDVPLLLSLFSNSTCLSKIQHLDLSDNFFGGTLPYVLANMTSLTYLDLSGNELNGSIPLWMRNTRNLEYLDLSRNNLTHVQEGAIIGLLGNLCKLIHFDLSHNSMGGRLETNHNNSYKCLPYDLEILRLEFNMIGGNLPSFLGDFKYLRVLHINHNRITGPIPISMGRLSYLEELDLSNNNLTGALPQGLGQCKSLVHIDLSSNFLHGALSESHFDTLSKLEYLDLSLNVVDWNITSNWSPPFQLSDLHMRSCKIQAQFPRWIGDQTKLRTLDFSDNNMFGELPQCFSSNQLNLITISHNQITGPVPYFTSSKLTAIYLSFNLLSGPLVHHNHNPSDKNDTIGISVCQLSSLWYLDLQKNNISGGIPDGCWGASEFLYHINLDSNNLSGIIPLSMGLILPLTFLKLSENSLHGPIPPTMSTNFGFQVLDLADNQLDGNIPSNWEGSGLQLLRLRGNQLVGSIPPKLCSIHRLKFIDLSFNNLTGSIPRCFGSLLQMQSHSVDVHDYLAPFINPDFSGQSTMVDLKGAELQYTENLLYVVNLDLSSNSLIGSIPEEITNLTGLIGLNLSHNHLTGNIPNKIGEMTSLESLDLSNNNLSGTISPSISDLTSLVRLNLSYNNLQGQIPTGHQLQVLEDPSMTYIGNPGLCGDPLPNKCRTKQTENQPIQGQEKPHKELKKEVWEKPVLYLVIMSGFATGFWGVVGSLLLNRRFRFAFFQLVGNVADYLYVQVMIRLNRLRN